MKRLALGLIAMLLTVAVANAATVVGQVRAYRVAHETQILEDFSRLLAMPNVATHISDIEKNAAFITAALNQRGFRTQLLSAGPGTPPVARAPFRSPDRGSPGHRRRAARRARALSRPPRDVRARRRSGARWSGERSAP